MWYDLCSNVFNSKSKLIIKLKIIFLSNTKIIQTKINGVPIKINFFNVKSNKYKIKLTINVSTWWRIIQIEYSACLDSC